MVISDVDFIERLEFLKNIQVPHPNQFTKRGFTPSAVLVGFVQSSSGEWNVVLTRRAATMKLFASDVCFPGGKMEPDDSNVTETALRETFEEIGVESKDIQVIGTLYPSPIWPHFITYPVVAIYSASAFSIEKTSAMSGVAVLSTKIGASTEVELIFSIPLRRFLSNQNMTMAVSDTGVILLTFEDFLNDGTILMSRAFVAFLLTYLASVVYRCMPNFHLPGDSESAPHNVVSKWQSRAGILLKNFKPKL